MKDEIKPFKTADRGLAAFLHYNGLEVLGTKIVNEKYKEFILVDNKNRSQLVDNYISQKNSDVVAAKYERSYKLMGKILRNGPTV